MIHKKFLFAGSLNDYITRIISFKEKKSLTLYSLFLEIISRMFRIIWDKSRRYFLIVNPRYDYYGWRSRSDSLIENDFLASAATKSAFVEDQVDLGNASSFLELGCNSGVNLFELARKYPHCAFLGIDFNANSISFACELAKNEGLNNLNFVLVDLQNRNSFKAIENTHWDVIFSWASLIYVHPRKIRDLINFCIARSNRLILIEQHKNMRMAAKGMLLHKQPTWIRDYVKIVKKSAVNKGVSISVKVVENHIWHPGGGMLP